MIRGGCLATSLPENVDLKQILLIFSQQENDGVNFLKQEYDEQKNNLKYFPIILFPNMQILNKNMGSGRHSLILEVELEMDHFRYYTDNFLGAESVAPKPVE